MKFKLTGWTVRTDDKHLTIDTHSNGTIDFNVDTFEEYFWWSFTVDQLRSLADQAETLQRKQVAADLMEGEMANKTMNLVQAAKHCEVNRQTLRKYANQDRIKCGREGEGVGTRYYFRVEDLDSFLDNRWPAGTWKVVEVAE